MGESDTETETDRKKQRDSDRESESMCESRSMIPGNADGRRKRGR